VKRILIAILILAVLASLAGVVVFLMSREETTVPVEGYGASTGSLGGQVGTAIDRQGALLVADDFGNKVRRVAPR
jgi:glucose/arabinose dehydrogenase